MRESQGSLRKPMSLSWRPSYLSPLTTADNKNQTFIAGCEASVSFSKSFFLHAQLGYPNI